MIIESVNDKSHRMTTRDVKEFYPRRLIPDSAELEIFLSNYRVMHPAGSCLIMAGLAIANIWFPQPSQLINPCRFFADLPIKSKGGRLHSVFRVPRSGDARGELLTLIAT